MAAARETPPPAPGGVASQDPRAVGGKAAAVIERDAAHRDGLAVAGSDFAAARELVMRMVGNVSDVVDAKPLLEQAAAALAANDMNSLAVACRSLAGVDKQVPLVKQLVEALTKLHGGGMIQVVELDRKVHKLDREEDKPRDEEDFAAALRTRRRFYNLLPPGDPRRRAIADMHPDVLDVEAVDVEPSKDG